MEAAIIRPPDATSTNIRYNTQNAGLRKTCSGVKLRAD